MTVPDIACSSCGSVVAQRDTDGGWCVRTKIVKVGNGGSVNVRCRNCGELVPLPLAYQKPEPKIVVRRSHDKKSS